MLTSRIELIQQPTDSLEAEDIFASASDQLFPDSTRVFHGDAGTRVRYNSAAYGSLELSVTEPADELERSKFAHALWNASILLCELIGSAATLSSRGKGGCDEEEEVASISEKENIGTGIWCQRSRLEVWNMVGESVLELGAGAGLAGIVSALAGAEEVYITDYPLPQILHNISVNVSENVPEKIRSQVKVKGHEWGKLSDSFAEQYAHHFSCILAADTLWMKSQHMNLYQSIAHFLAFSSTARAIVVAGFHTGREIVASFFNEIDLQSVDLVVDSIWEEDVDNLTRHWMGDNFVEPFQERMKWHVAAVLKWRSST